jgi:hypothetical protein
MSIDNQVKPLAEMVFLSEIVKQAKIAKRASERLAATKVNFDELEVWCSIQSILVAAGNISKILWPVRRDSIKRGKRLRVLLDIDDQNLLSDRKLRNHFEHYDERIEDWFEKNNSAVYMDSYIDPFKPIWGSNFSNIHRSYNPLTGVLTFRDESVDVSAILRELDDIISKCRNFALV